MRSIGSGRHRTKTPSIFTGLRHYPRHVIAAAAICWLAGLAASASATTTTWHPDLEAASRASATSGKPVLVIFTAAWSPACEQFVQQTLPTPEVEAILDACFEPVRLDVDAAAAVAKDHGVAHLPTACVLDGSMQLLARFECPDQPAQFVRLAASAARETTALLAARQPAAVADRRANDHPHAVADVSRAPADFPGHESSADPSIAQAVAAVSVEPRPVASNDPRSTPSAFTAPSAHACGPQSGQSACSFSTMPEPSVVQSHPIDADGTAVRAGSAFTSQGSIAAQPPTGTTVDGLASSGFQTRPFVEPTTKPADPPVTPPAPWLGTDSTAQATGVAGQPASGAGVTTYSGFPSYSSEAPSVAGQSVQQATATDAGESRVATATPPSEQPESPKENPVVGFFKKSFAGISTWASRGVSKRDAKDAKEPIVKPAEQAVAAASPPTGSQSPRAGMPLGLEGYCPVTLKDKASWVEGRTQFGACHRGRTYLFAGEAEQRSFLANPDLYAPALSGDDPVMAFDAGRQIPGQRQYGVTYQSRVYLFSSPQTQAVFTASPERYVGRVMVAENPSATGTTLR